MAQTRRVSLPIILAPAAEHDFAGTLTYLRERNRRVAQRLQRRVERVLQLLAHGSIEGREVVLVTGECVRRWVVTDQVIYYQRTATALLVARIYPGRRDALEK